MGLSPIKELLPTETGGRIARKGFIYQDHIAASFIIDLLTNPDLLAIWLEGEDDIVLLKSEKDNIIVEMIQVKSNDLNSRWSIPKLVSEELLKKSLARGRCEEDVCYRVITSTDIDSDLIFMKSERNDDDRDNSAISQIIETYQEKFTTINDNLKGHGVKDWFEKCCWEVWPLQLDAVRAKNLIKLEQCLQKKYEIILPPDQRTEIYQKLLAFVVNAGVGDEKFYYTKEEISIWFDKLLFELAAPRVGSEKLIEKLKAAKVGPDTQATAREFKWHYEKESLNFNFYSRTEISSFKTLVHTLIQSLKLEYDNDSLEMDDSEFHRYCWVKVKALAALHNVKDDIALGCMYDNTNRCTHRFTKASV